MDIVRFITLYEDDDITLLAEIAPSFMDGVFLHTEVKQFSLSKMKKYISLWGEIVPYLHEQGHRNIYALPTDSVAEKWETKFGFKDTGVFFEGQKIMKYMGA